MSIIFFSSIICPIISYILSPKLIFISSNLSINLLIICPSIEFSDELIPYHSRGIAISSKLTNIQLDYLVGRFEESINFIINFKPKLFIFNGNPWYLLLIKNKLISEFEKIPITNKFNVYLFKIKNIPSVLFDKFFQKHFWGMTNEHRRIKIPNLITNRFPSILSK
jgi:hypothetical protein